MGEKIDRRDSIPKFLQGVFLFVGAGYENPCVISDALSYMVPPDRRTQPIYFRGGNSSGEMVFVVLTRDGVPMRWFPIGARSGTHVPLAVVEDLMPDTKVELRLGAQSGATGVVMIDFGMVEI
ncbi:MAG: molybdopterin oxidoreductase [Methylocystis sp.]